VRRDRRHRASRVGAPLRVTGILAWLAITTLSLPSVVLGSAGPVVPDASCADEHTYKSLKGDTPALLDVFNKTPATVSVYWLDYSGKRVLYQQLPPFTEYQQRTWLTHPWVLTDASGQCWRFLVMTSQLQSVTVEGEPPDPDATTLPLSARATIAPTAAPTPSPAPTAAPTPAPATAGPVVTPAASAAGVPASSSDGSSNTGLIVVAAVAAVVVAGAAAAPATGRLPEVGRRRP